MKLRNATDLAGGVELLLAALNAVWGALLVVERLSSKGSLAAGADEALVVPLLLHSRNNGALDILVAFAALLRHVEYLLQYANVKEVCNTL